MLMPKRFKYRKHHKGKIRGMAHRGNTMVHGEYALMALEPSWVTSRQIEAARRSITNYIRRGGKVWIRIFPDKPMTRKPAETRMGKGKGAVDHYVAVVKPGRIMFELGGVRSELALEALRRAAQKMPVKCKILTREEMEASE
ncbi:MAG: 50S ribosomal protein L16 [Chloroflexi bacterium AL-W]|nr:50S ribosomal protein L16 [Chloroflexi bacterium AL-N1]NOK66741.1 50S ribosomal protein L16 [Chloroflexi bacterium AL-N10]NOK74967.1 50S ribosomal protein L16 [Chloroflexi bacterium AL-N5]NOK81344.1 50S ribosomal protein L16 [Chloroflexi bacterium AL-W]NOK88813.1 50S ribosomal protein L16 [Chloroflexi bacterium AL-N15]